MNRNIKIKFEFNVKHVHCTTYVDTTKKNVCIRDISILRMTLKKKKIRVLSMLLENVVTRYQVFFRLDEFHNNIHIQKIIQIHFMDYKSILINTFINDKYYNC